jgi:uncharacterized damage-inducible protein DinB
MPFQFTTSCLEDSIALFRQYKELAEKAIAQVTDEQLAATLDPEMNSIAITVKHMAGNMRSRWTDFLTTDGEKPDRHRDSEFVEPPDTREALMRMWDDGWKLVFDALEGLSDDDLKRTVEIRAIEHSVLQAIHRQVAHYAYHCGQIVLLAKHFQYERWQSLSIARGQSEAVNQKLMARS